MLTTFAVWAALGLSLRLALGHALRSKLRRRLAVPQSLAGAAIYTAGVLSLLALLPIAPSLKRLKTLLPGHRGFGIESTTGKCWPITS